PGGGVAGDVSGAFFNLSLRGLGGHFSHGDGDAGGAHVADGLVSPLWRSPRPRPDVAHAPRTSSLTPPRDGRVLEHGEPGRHGTALAHDPRGRGPPAHRPP